MRIMAYSKDSSLFLILVPHGICGGLNGIDPNRLIGNGAFSRCGLVGVGMALLKEACHYGWALEF